MSGFLILDACVLIDFLDADDSCLGRVAKHVPKLHVARPVFDEVDQLNLKQARAQKLEIVEVGVELLKRAHANAGALSVADWTCILIAESKGWTCVTNDGRLRRECESLSVDVLWGLQMLLEAVRGGLPKKYALTLAKEMQANDPHYFPESRLADFITKVNQI